MRYVCEFDYNDRYFLRDIVDDITLALDRLTSELEIGLDGGQLLRCYPLSILEPVPATGFVKRDVLSKLNRRIRQRRDA